MTGIPHILITPGEPAGIGPEITAEIAQQSWNAVLIAVCDPDLLQERAKKNGLTLNLKPFDISVTAQAHKPGNLYIIPVKLKSPSVAGKLNVDNAQYVIECLNIATDLCLKDNTRFALVTGPVQKSIMNDAGIAFSGHTELLAQRCNVSRSIMLFVFDQIRVALATTHLPLSKVSQAITKQLLIETLQILHAELQNKFKIAKPRIIVCGLNPHAGESGHMGHEEIDTIEPALAFLRDQNINVIGPLPADSVFTEKQLQKTDAVLAMYHDQALPVVKYMSFGHAVNVTLGLPIIRTSVDHGTALDIAELGTADSGSLAAAIQLAIELSINRVKNC